MTQAYPLAWPKGRYRTSPEDRKRARFTKAQSVSGQSRKRQVSITLSEATKRLLDEAQRIGAENFVLSSNLELRNDGLPRSGQRMPSDPGVCIYFLHDGKQVAMPCDTYDTVEGNIAAVAAHIEATRSIERHGVASVSQMFSGFAALPAPDNVKPTRPWWVVLGMPKGTYSKEVIEAVFRDKAKSAHPDAGGSTDAMTELNNAKAEALGG